MEPRARSLSKFGIVSCLLAVGVWLYFAVLIFAVTRTDLASSLNRLLASGQSGMSRGLADMGTAILVLVLLFVVVPVIGHFAGFICGAIGIFRRTTKRWPAVIGIVLNALPVMIGVVLFLIGWAVSS